MAIAIPRSWPPSKRRSTQLDQVIFAGFTHQPAEDLARGLIAIAPARSGPCLLFRQRFDRGGSGAENGAGLLAQPGAGPRSRIIALEHAYHGDTIGTMSAGARGVFNAAYEPLLFDVERLPFPARGRESETLAALERLAPDAAALIVEPLMLGAGGMLTYAPEMLPR